MNWFVVALTVLQIGASGQYVWQAKWDHAALYLFFAIINVILMRLEH